MGDDSAETNRERLLRRVVQDVAREVPEYGEQLRRHGKRAVRAALHAQGDALAAATLAHTGVLSGKTP